MPGGVGPMTVAMLLSNTVDCAKAVAENSVCNLLSSIMPLLYNIESHVYPQQSILMWPGLMLLSETVRLDVCIVKAP